MHSKPIPGDATITESEPQNKRPARRVIYCFYKFLCLILLTFQAPAGVTLAVPAEIAWRVPLASNQDYRLEIAADPQFGSILHQAVVGGSSYTWDTPNDGVFHWRLIRPNLERGGGEGNTFLSGSFISISPDAVATGPARVEWAKVPGATRYMIFVVEDGRDRTMQTTDHRYFLTRVATPLMLEVSSYRGDRPLQQQSQVNPSLRLVMAGNRSPTPAPPSQPVATPKPAPSPAPAPPPDPPATFTETTPATEPAAQPEPATAPDKAPEQMADEVKPEATAVASTSKPAANAWQGSHRHAVMLWVQGGQETIRAQKLELDLESEQPPVGAGLALATAPHLWLHVLAQASYHDHVTELADVDGGEPFLLEAARLRSTFQVGLNLLGWTGKPRHSLLLTVGALLEQAPWLPTEFSGAPGLRPSFRNESVTLPGGGAAYVYRSDNFGLIAQASYYVDGDEASAADQQALAYWRHRSGWLVGAGAFNTFFQGKRCADDAATCLVEGDVHVLIKHLGGMALTGWSF